MRRLAAVAALVALAVAVPATPAAAHTELSKAVPAAKSTATKPVAAVTLTFSGLIKQAGSVVEVVGPDGVGYAEGAAKAVDKTITQAVVGLPVGTITVRWQTVSGDGHKIKGSYTFSNKAAPQPVATTAPATVVPTVTQAPVVDAVAPILKEPASSAVSVLGWTAGAIGLAVVLGAVVFLLRRRREPR